MREVFRRLGPSLNIVNRHWEFGTTIRWIFVTWNRISGWGYRRRRPMCRAFVSLTVWTTDCVLPSFCCSPTSGSGRVSLPDKSSPVGHHLRRTTQNFIYNACVEGRTCIPTNRCLRKGRPSTALLWLWHDRSRASTSRRGILIGCAVRLGYSCYTHLSQASVESGLEEVRSLSFQVLRTIQIVNVMVSQPNGEPKTFNLKI